jgi:hypothetical protein
MVTRLCFNVTVKKTKKKETTLAQDIDARIKQLEGEQLTRAQAVSPILKDIEKVLAKAAPTLKIRSAKDFAGIAKAHSSLVTTQRLCSGLETEKVSGDFFVRLITNVEDE